MPTYVYECPEHGRFDVVKPMADSGLPEWCSAQVPGVTGTLPCLSLMTRVYTVPTIQGETVPGGVHGGSGDGYFFNKKSGLRSAGRGKR